MRKTWADILEMAERQGVVTPADVRGLGLAPENLNKLAKTGRLVKIGRGLYRHPDFEPSERHSVVEVAKAVPDGVICLLSALGIHGIGTQMAWDVWIAIPRGRRTPATRTTRIRAVTMISANHGLDVDEHQFEGVPIRVYSLERTIVDCFRLRRLVGHDVAVEALREAIGTQKVDISKLLHLAGLLRTRRLIQPYVEALL